MGTRPNYLGLIGPTLLLVGVVVMAAIALFFYSFFASRKSSNVDQPEQPATRSTPPFYTPTARPNDKDSIQRVAERYLAERDKRESPYYSAVGGISVEGDWAVVYVIGRDRATHMDLPAGVGLMIAHRSNSKWMVARSGDPQFEEWLQNIPDSLISQSDRKYLH